MPDPCLGSSDCIDYFIDDDGNLVIEPIISPDDGNGLQCLPNGLFASSPPVPVETAFPGSPTDGEEFFFDYDSFTRWRFVYDASESSAYKWKWVGGPPAISRVDTEVDILNPDGSLVWGFAAGPEITLPFAGYYLVDFGAAIDASQDGFVAQVGVAKQGDDPGNDDVAENGTAHIASVTSSMILPTDGTPFALANTVVRLYRRADGDGSGTARFVHRFMEITPRKVGP